MVKEVSTNLKEVKESNLDADNEIGIKSRSMIKEGKIQAIENTSNEPITTNRNLEVR